ncbi:RNA ligase family protein [Ponticoccus alexandrii]|uniref:2'-5' RNA ligase n=1 Tax=Ponticoccus alexandrii TaxID=1943633 RepID=A0ABX7FC55_9RHOB|nr:RNA ligase family protein [Ponticoccus alexandrii]KID12624.1 hypothetical protein P279_26385 [Rhodobacteraceae bacterium PD-2]QRF68150.1 2'-5' RNA ligase [Ponticoccus alexandrii]
MTETRFKYPRTFHLPGSPGMTSDDKLARDLSAFAGAEVVVTEKMDGENTTLYPDGFHARSLDSGFHPSRARLAALHGQIAHRIPAGRRICGENLFARHSLAYDDLPSHFLVFSIWTGDTCLSWDETRADCIRLSLTPVPELYRGPFTTDLPDRMARALDTDRQEGFVLRLASEFKREAFSRSVVKWVRKNHVQTDEHWRRGPLVANGFREGEGS